MSMTVDLPQCQEQRRGGGGTPKNVSLRAEAGADENEGEVGGGTPPPPKKKCQSEGGRGWPSRMSRTTPGQAQIHKKVSVLRACMEIYNEETNASADLMRRKSKREQGSVDGSKKRSNDDVRVESTAVEGRRQDKTRKRDTLRRQQSHDATFSTSWEERDLTRDKTIKKWLNFGITMKECFNSRLQTLRQIEWELRRESDWTSKITKELLRDGRDK